MTYRDRRKAAVSLLPPDVDALLVTKLVNVRYLTGFTGSNGALLLGRDCSAVLATDGRYQVQAAAEAPDVEVLETRALGTDLVTATCNAGWRRLAIERHHVTLAMHDALLAAADDVEIVDGGKIVETLRARKDDDEVAALEHACDITDRAFAQILTQLRPGVTERDIAWSLASAMRLEGAEGEAFESIVAFGRHSAIPHHQPTDRALQRGDLAKLDFGARVRGYHADMTRTVVCGPPADWQRDLHEQVADVQAQCLAAAVAGAMPAELNDVASRFIIETGNRPLHGLGHGVGLEIHEEPFLTPATIAGPLEPAMVVTIEPGIYLPERGGVRIEDTVVVTSAGARSLTRSPRELVEL